MASSTPVIRSLTGLFKEPLPKEPVVLHLTEAQWTKLSDGIELSKRRIGPDAKGLFVLPDPFGGYLGFFACAAGSGEGVACLPEIVRTRGMITFGTGCTCLRGKDPVERPPVEVDTCALGFTTAGRLTCTGGCASGRTCRLVRKQTGGRTFLTCECS